MQFTVNVNKFRNHVAMVTPVIGKTFLPILNNILVNAENGKVSLFATNTTQSVFTEFECNCTNGNCTVPARKIFAILDSLDQNDDVTFEADDNALVKMVTPSGSFTLLGSPAKDYPESPRHITSAQTTLDSEVVNAMVALCKNAVVTDGPRPQLAGMFLHFDNDATHAIATDGKRMAVYSLETDNAETLSPVIVPTSALPYITKLVGDVQFDIQDSMLVAKGDNMTIATKLVPGQFPNWKNVIPRSFKESIEVNGELLSKAVKLVSTVTEVNQSINLEFSADRLTLSANSSSIGSASQQIPLERGVADPIDININPVFLLNAINGNKESLFIKLNDSLSPLMVECGENVFTIIMPLRRK